MISIIVPVYNVKLYIKEAIESILSQSYTDYEVILVDDGSTDGSGAICDYYAKKDDRIRVIHQCNKGLSAARNVGLDICKGDLIAFLDPDDALCNDMLMKMYNALMDSSADIVECNFAFYKCNHRMNPSHIHKMRRTYFASEGLYNMKEAICLQLQEKIAPNAWNKLYRSEIWNDLRFREGQNYEDLDIILPVLSKAESVYVIDDVLIMHRKRPNSITTTNSFKNARDRRLAYKHYMSFIKNNCSDIIDGDVRKDAMVKYYKVLLSEYFHLSFRRGGYRKKYIALLRKCINDARKDINISECSLRVRLGTFIYLHVPLVISGIIYWIYRPFRIIYYKVLSR
ncbi:Glycosyl transferase family 2 [Lachnospiraceae bacterium]|nr:Glycosyl transferase family 2 [Lachnospiraceae bacterium]